MYSRRIFGRTDTGFTLIEVMVSMTIMSLVITVLYLAFSTGVRVWTRQEDKTDNAQQLFIVTKFLKKDFINLRPYTFNWENGKSFFFTGNKDVLFYVTSNGFASKDRDKGELFFTCMYLKNEEENGTSLYLYKSPYPSLELLENFHDLRQNNFEASFFLPSQAIVEDSILLLEGLDTGGFVIGEEKHLRLLEEEADEKEIQTDPDTELAMDDSVEEVTEIPFTKWDAAKLPLSVQFLYQMGGNNFAIFAQVERAQETKDEKK